MTTIYDLPEPGNAAQKRSLALSECIQKDIAASPDGILSFSRFMALALYHPQYGYYQSDTFDLGKQGDFTTAPEMSPLFAACFARQALPIFTALGQTEILELGAGTGRFACDLIKELEQLGSPPSQYFIYEISPALRRRQQQVLQAACPTFFPRIVWLEHLPEHFTGLIIANEVLDALPTDRFCVQESVMTERGVAWENDAFVWRSRTPGTPELAQQLSLLQTRYPFPEGYESEINLQLSPFIQALARSLSQGVILLADYGYGQQEYYHPQRRQGTLTCFYQHRRHDNPLLLPGLQDITAHVDFTRVIEEAMENDCTFAGYTTQAAFLLGCGLLQIAQEQEKNLSQAEVFEQRQAMKRLTLPTEMGERVKIMALAKNLDLPLAGFALQDRRRDL